MKNIYDSEEEMLIETKIKPNLKKIYDMKIMGLKDKYIAQALGIGVVKFHHLMEQSPIMQDTYNDAMEIFCAKLTDVVVGRALGTDGRLDDKGKPLPPDEKMAFKLLEKLDSRFSVKTEVKQTVTIETIIKGITEKQKEIEEKEEVNKIERKRNDNDILEISEEENGEILKRKREDAILNG